MYAVRCPQCGQPGPVTLARPEQFTCSACGFAGAVPGEVAQDLRRAGAVVSAHDARERQPTRFQHRMALSSGFGTAVIEAPLRRDGPQVEPPPPTVDPP